MAAQPDSMTLIRMMANIGARGNIGSFSLFFNQTVLKLLRHQLNFSPDWAILEGPASGKAVSKAKYNPRLS